MAKRAVARNQDTTVKPTNPNDLDLSKLTVSQLKQILKEKRAMVQQAMHKESREQKIGRLAAYVQDCSEWSAKAQAKLDAAIKREDDSRHKLDKLVKKYQFTAGDVEHATAEYRKERQEKTKTKQSK